MGYRYLKKHYHESLKVMGLHFIVAMSLVGWLIYGNVLFWSNKNDCSSYSSGLNFMMLILLVLGYMEMLKCCLTGTLVCCMVPFFLFASRRAQRPNWVPAPPNFVKNLYKARFNPTKDEAF